MKFLTVEDLGKVLRMLFDVVPNDQLSLKCLFFEKSIDEPGARCSDRCNNAVHTDV